MPLIVKIRGLDYVGIYLIFKLDKYDSNGYSFLTSFFSMVPPYGESPPSCPAGGLSPFCRIVATHNLPSLEVIIGIVICLSSPTSGTTRVGHCSPYHIISIPIPTIPSINIEIYTNINNIDVRHTLPFCIGDLN